MKRKAVFLDRDGVINRAVVRDGKPYPPLNADKVQILPGVRTALARLYAAGFRLIVVTNQPDVARGIQSRETVEAIHAKLIASGLPLDSVRVCYHDDADGCQCRKPAPGMLVAAAEEGDLDLPSSYMIGDRWRDVEAGRRAGCKTIFIDYGYAERVADAPDVRVASLLQAAEWILKRG